MLISLLFCIYISFVCWTWGLSFLLLIKKITGTTSAPLLSGPLKCLTGFTLITVVAGYASIFTGLDNLIVHVILFLLTVLLLLKKECRITLKQDLNAFKNLTTPTIVLLCVLALLVLQLSSYEIYHPDTLGYHAQLIKWSGDYKLTPGIIHLNHRYGLQSSWFVGCSLFRFGWLGMNGIGFVNSAMLLWYLFYMLMGLSNGLRSTTPLSTFGWIMFLALTCWSFTQLRLTALSASPDFIAALYCWFIIFYFFKSASLKPPAKIFTYSILFLFIAFSVTIKLSAAPLAIIAAYILIYLIKSIRPARWMIVASLAFAMVLPFLIRNAFTSGYPLYPSTAFDFLNVDWKLDKILVNEQVDYINAYARTAVVETMEDVIRINNMRFTEWFPLWLSKTSFADKIILLLSLASLLAILFYINRVLKGSLAKRISLLTILIALLAWLMNAPDPRFAWGYLMLLPVIAVQMIYLNEDRKHLPDWIYHVVVYVAIGISSAYLLYRFIYFQKPLELIQPTGLREISSAKINCGNSTYFIPLPDQPCGEIDLPCTTDSCNKFEARGNELTDGFRAK